MAEHEEVLRRGRALATTHGRRRGWARSKEGLEAHRLVAATRTGAAGDERYVDGGGGNLRVMMTTMTYGAARGMA